MEEVVVFLSPHLDDAVLSCAGQICSEARTGRRVVVATVFSAGDHREESQECYGRRRAEDSNATQILGAESVWLDLPDAPFRRDYYRSFRQIVFDTHPDDVGYVVQVAERVRALCSDIKPIRLYAPLGVGTHIDHRLTHTAVCMLGDLPEVTYYEDRPYALVRHAVRMRLNQLGMSPNRDRGPKDFETLTDNVLKTSFLQSFDAAHWTHTYLPLGPERESCKSLLVADLLQGNVESNGVSCAKVQGYGDEIFSRVTAAVTAYSSQFPDLFASSGDFIAQSRDYSNQLEAGSAYAERYWPHSNSFPGR